MMISIRHKMKAFPVRLLCFLATVSVPAGASEFVVVGGDRHHVPIQLAKRPDRAGRFLFYMPDSTPSMTMAFMPAVEAMAGRGHKVRSFFCVACCIIHVYTYR